MKRSAAPLLLFSLATACFATSNDDPYSPLDKGTSLFFGGGPSIPMVGSWERRAAGIAGLSTWLPEPKLHHFLGDHVDTVWQFYGEYHSGRDGRYEPDPTWALGFTYGYRKSWETKDGRGWACELYWGANQGDRGSRDLPSSFNSTPGLIFSWLRPGGIHNFNANLQYMHMSNAGTYSPNRGENFFLLTLEFKLH